MSVIACRIKDNTIYVAADSQATRCDDTIDNGSMKLGGRKLIKHKDIIVGSTGGLQESSMLNMYIKQEGVPRATIEDVFCLFSNFYKFRNQMLPNVKECDNISDNQYLLVFSGHAFYIEQLLVGEIFSNHYHAFGSGWLTALGAMEMGAMPKQAVQISCKYNVFCSPPIISYEVPYGKRHEGKA